MRIFRGIVPCLIAMSVARLGHAQANSVAGTVVAGGTQRPLAGVQVAVVGVPGKGTTTDGSGRFAIGDISGSTVVLNFRFLGYRPVVDTVNVGRRDLQIAL